MINKYNYSNSQLIILVIARVLMGWYCLYEGITKLINPNWSSLAYLIDSKGIFSGIFHSLASNSTILLIVDFLNIWGLIIIGLGLILGLFTRIATIAAIVLLGFYYLSHPAIIGAQYILPSEGSYLWVNKTLIEIFLLSILLVFPTGKHIGIDRFIYNKKRNLHV